jgi:prepilin-type N-terminal cleavage/methylation domain-containing protein
MRTTSSRRRSSAFTLIELLVVIGIIALLMGLLMPTISGGMDRAREVMCSSNLKQLALASINYAGDHDGQLPMSSGASGWVNCSGTATYWCQPTTVTTGVLFPYIKDDRAYLCPTFSRIARAAYPTVTFSYAMNFRVTAGTGYYISQLSSVPHPGSRVFISDENPPIAPWFPATINGVQVAGYAINDGQCCWGDGGAWNSSSSLRDSPGTFHRNSTAKAAFFDGHADTFAMDSMFQWRYKMEPTAP